jgi:cytochrome c553
LLGARRPEREIPSRLSAAISLSIVLRCGTRLAEERRSAGAHSCGAHKKKERDSMLARKLIGSAVILGLFATYGCGDDDDDDDGTGARAGTSGASGKAGSSGKGGTAGKAGAGGTAGRGGAAGASGRAGNAGTAGAISVGGSAGFSGDGGEGGEGGSPGGGEGGAQGGEGGGGAGSGGSDAGSGGEGGADAMVERGRYLVHHVAACIDCHTPRLNDGSLDTTRLLGGNPTFADLVPGDDTLGSVPTPNLTPHATGLGGWTDDQVKNAFLNGVDNGGGALLSVMPYYVFHNMRDEDADSIVAYLRSLPAINQEIPPRQPLPSPVTEPADPVPAAAIPDTTLSQSDPDYARAQNGRYLAGFIGTCMECHSAEATGAIPIDVNALFAGGRVFAAAALQLPSPPFPAEIVSPNLTPDATGIADYSVAEVVRAIREGIDDQGDRLCPPMPSGPMLPFAGLTEDDAEDIALYLTTIPAVESDAYPACTPPEEGAAGAAGTGG